MKKFTRTMLAALGLWLLVTTSSNAGVQFGIYLGGPVFQCPAPVLYGPGCGYYGPAYYPAYYHGYRWHRYHGYYRGYRGH